MIFHFTFCKSYLFFLNTWVINYGNNIIYAKKTGKYSFLNFFKLDLYNSVVHWTNVTFFLVRTEKLPVPDFRTAQVSFADFEHKYVLSPHHLIKRAMGIECVQKQGCHRTRKRIHQGWGTVGKLYRPLS